MSDSSQRTSDLPSRGKVQSVLIGAIHAAAVVALVAMMLHVLANVVARSVFNTTVPLTFELTQYYYLPILASLGFIAAQYRGEHITAEVFYHLFRRGEKRLIIVMTSLVSGGVAFGFAYYTFERAQYASSVRLVYGVTSLQVWPVLYLLPVCFALMGVLILVQLRSKWSSAELVAAGPGEIQSDGASSTPDSGELHGEELL